MDQARPGASPPCLHPKLTPEGKGLGGVLRPPGPSGTAQGGTHLSAVSQMAEQRVVLHYPLCENEAPSVPHLHIFWGAGGRGLHRESPGVPGLLEVGMLQQQIVR